MMLELLRLAGSFRLTIDGVLAVEAGKEFQSDN